MSLNNFGRCNRSSDLLGTRRLVLKSRKQVDLFFRKAQVHSSVCEKKCYERKLTKKRYSQLSLFWLKVSSNTYVLKICIGTINPWQDREKTIKYFESWKSQKTASYKLNMIWNMIEVKIAAITVRRCAKCLEFLAGKRKTRLKWLSVSNDAQWMTCR